MNRIILIIFFYISTASLMSQNISDALNYTDNNIDGSARFSSMSGAFGALGGEISSISANPAGSAIFNDSYFSLSFANNKKTNDVSLLNSSNTQDKSNLTMNQIGGVFVFNNIGAAKKWKKIVVGLSYDQTNNNFNEYFVRNFTNSNSIDSYFLANAQGLRLDQISAFENESITDAYVDIGNTFGYPHQQAFLGYESYIIEPDDINNPANSGYYSNVYPGSFNQTYYSISRGYNGKLTGNVGAQYSEKIYLGLNLNGHFVDYDNYNILEESNDNGQQGSLHVTDINFENRLSGFGSGFSFQIGTIAKLTDWLRIGLTYDSPVWYSIKEETRQYLATRFIDQAEQENSIVLDPNAINVFEEFTIQTPSKLTASFAVVIKNLGLISFDYSRKDFSDMEFKTKNSYDSHFSNLNSEISNNLTVANSYKIGGEIISNNMSYRAGYRIDGSPYSNQNQYSDRKGFTLGIGYKFRSSTIDLSFEKYNKQHKNQLYDAGLTNQASIDNNNSIIKLSITSIM